LVLLALHAPAFRCSLVFFLPITPRAPRLMLFLSTTLFRSTHSIISPGLSLRQCSSRCIFRAGRNLPDKEFRYLRTVIVTAAVYWGFDAVLRTEVLTHSLNLPAPGRCQPLYFA